MQLVLNTAEDVCHEAWMQETPGAYEWWYFDGLSDDGEWALVNIWFLGNPFSPYYRLAARDRAADPYDHTAFFLALYYRNRLHSYHFTRFPKARVAADAKLPAHLTLGDNALTFRNNAYRVVIWDENANRRHIGGVVTWHAPFSLTPHDSIPHAPSPASDSAHFWLPAAPACRMHADLTLRHPMRRDAERVVFTGSGYHDHNWGKLPFDDSVRDWYWARLSVGLNRAVLVYIVRSRGEPPTCHLLFFDHGRITVQEQVADVRLERLRINGFGARYHTRLSIQTPDLKLSIALGARLDSAPFYVRAVCSGALEHGGRQEQGRGIAEYFAPQMLSWAITASATKSRIVER